MREKLIELLRSDMKVLKAAGTSATATLRLADNLIANGVTFVKDTNVLTNADRIRAMSDEELADIVVCPHSENLDLCRVDCKKCRLEWLKQPAEGE